MAERDGAWIANATIAGGVDVDKNTHPLNCTTEGTLEVQVAGTDVPIDVIVDNVVPVSQSGTWTVQETNVDKNFGTWAYYAGTSGTVVVTAGQRVLGIGCHGTSAASFTINGGTLVPVPAGVSVNIEPLGNVVAPTIVFTGTDSYFIEVVS